MYLGINCSWRCCWPRSSSVELRRLSKPAFWQKNRKTQAQATLPNMVVDHLELSNVVKWNTKSAAADYSDSTAPPNTLLRIQGHEPADLNHFCWYWYSSRLIRAISTVSEWIFVQNNVWFGIGFLIAKRRFSQINGFVIWTINLSLGVWIPD